MDELNPTVEDRKLTIKAAALVLLEGALSQLQEDPHQWSTRPCPTCRAITSMLGKSFGCYLYADRKKNGGSGFVKGS